ncbi:MAG: hypothetical protein J5496_01705 [Lachnospiraceae bacterium]|nr:hypothetical protein [Lachnospiraceae bacterium]
MKLFFYYVFHSAKNALKKLFKTWVLVFIVVMLAGGLLVGGTIGILLKNAIPDGTEEPGLEQQDPDWQEEPGQEILPEDPAEEVPVTDVLELAAGAVILIVFVIGILGADKSGAQIFQPADVTLLFSSPMKPQSVLMFRTMTQIGASIVFVLYMMIFQIPNLVRNAGFDLWIVLAILVGLILMLGISQLLKMLCFVAGSVRPALKRNLRRIVYLVIAAIGLGLYFFKQSSGLGWWEAVLGYFNAPATRFIPFWGWIKGFVMFAAERNLTGALLCLAAVLLGGAFLAWLTWHMQADFYEEALQKTSEKAELLEAAQASGSGIALIRRKKDRSEKLRRNEFNRGQGASVFFHKALYNRFRFAHLGIFTKTLEFNLAVCLGAALFCRLIVGTESYLPVVLILAFLTFYRSLGNCLKEDTQMWYFHMIPEDPWAKLMCSLGGDMMNCLLDTFPPLLIALLVQRAPLYPALLWIFVIVSVTAYATSVGTFIDMSVNVNAGKTLKAMVQVVFLYFGLLPDAAIVGLLLLLKLPLLAVLAVTLFNFALSALFLFFASLTMGKK